MAFDREFFAVGMQGQGSGAPKVHSYRTAADNKLAAIASGYFNGVNEFLEAGDFIMTSATDGDLVIAIAAVSAAGVVTVTSVALI